jgi:hypothetical protein
LGENERGTKTNEINKFDRGEERAKIEGKVGA